MLYPDLIDVPFELWGGYCPAVPPSDLSPGAAAICQDMIFPQGAVRTRGGLKNAFAAGSPIPANASVNGLKSYITQTAQQRMMVYDSLGNLYKETPQGTLTLLASRPYTGLFNQSQNIFARNYQATFNSLGGADIPLQYDDTNLDRVSQSGPGAGPAGADFIVPVATITGTGAGAAVTISTATRGGTITYTVPASPPYYGGGTYSIDSNVTIVTAAPHGLSAGNTVNIAGVSAPASGVSFNGTQTVVSIVNATTFTYSQFGAVGDTGTAGTVTTQAPSVIRLNNIATAITTAPHGFIAGWFVSQAGLANVTIGGGIAGITRQANVTTVITAAAHGLKVNSQVFITGVTGDTSFNSTVGSTFTVTGIINATTFTYTQILADSLTGTGGNVQDVFNGTFQITATPTTTTYTYNSIGPDDQVAGAGTATIIGNVSAGLHQVAISFITRQGYITKPSTPVTISAGGNKLLSLTGIPTGPPNIVGRLIVVTPAITPPAVTGSFYSVTSTMVVSDNTTTSVVIDFIDSVLISSFNANYLFTQLELGECAFTVGYNSRTVWLGERNKLQNLVNMSFDGGFAAGFPLGWTLDPVNSAGGSAALAGGFTADWGDAYAITGNGATAIRGAITQSAYKDSLGVAIISPLISYSVRARVARNVTLAQGNLHINLTSVIQAFTTVGLTVNAAQVGTSYAEFTAVITAPLTSVPSDLVLQVYVNSTPTNNGVFLVDSIEIYPTNTPFNYSTARISHAFNPESFDGTLDQVQIRPGDGQKLTAGFPLRNNLYLAKDHYLCSVTDDGVNEPASWAVNEISATIGICGPNAVDWTEEWAVFAERSGVYICWGSDPVKISPEIQVDASGTGQVSWQSINWTLAHTIWVRIDQTNRRILVGVPVGETTGPNFVFMLDYTWLDGGQDIAASPLITYSSFTGKILSHGRGRRWSLWTIKANSMTFAERSDGTAQPIFGNGNKNGNIYQQIDCATQPTDDGAAIPWKYQGYGCPSTMDEQALQLGSHRKLAGYLKFRAVGVGLLPVSITTTLRTTVLRSYNLTLTPTGDGERPLNIHGERFYLNFGINTVAGNWTQIERAVLCMKRDAAIPVRGFSS